MLKVKNIQVVYNNVIMVSERDFAGDPGGEGGGPSGS